MKSTGFRALYASALSFALVGVMLSGCSGGGGGSTTLPSTPNTGGGTTTTTPTAPTSDQSGTINISMSDADVAAAAGASHFVYHALPVLKQQTSTRPQNVEYPADLVYAGGPVLKTVVSHNIYLNDTASEWGDPQGFLNHLNNSTFIHTTDQYVGSTANGRYKTGANAFVSKSYFLNIDNIVPQTDLIAFAHAAAKVLGHGYTNIYHIFLPKGYDTCFDGTSICYSPDVPSTFFFCAYHGSVTFPDAVGHVILSVEPYQNVPGCRTSDTLPPIGPQPPPNGQLQDSTDSVLSHEYFESITDPDPSSGWTNPDPQYGFGEIGDLCRFKPYVVISLNGHPYEIQREYSNAVHGCVN